LITFLPSFAQSGSDSLSITQDTVRLREVVVLSSYRVGDDTPVTHQNINSEEIEQKNIGQEPSFLLSQTPSVTAYSDAGSYFGYSYFRLRGMDQTRVNMTLNGVPLNEPEDQGAYFSNYPDFLNSIQSMQIQRGVGTSTNGVASYAGSINFESASLFRPKKELYAGYGSFNSHRVFGEYATGLKKKQGLYLRASSLHSDGYKEHSGNTSQSVFYSYGFFAKKHLLKLTGFAGNQRNQMAWIGSPLDSLRKNPRYNANSPNEKDHFIQSLTMLQHTATLGKDATLNTSVYYNFLKGYYDLDLNNFLGFPSNDELYNYAFLSHFVGVFSHYSLQTKNWKVQTGFHLNTYQRQHRGSERLAGELYRNTGFKNEQSVFLKSSYSLGKLLLFGDAQLRYTVFRYVGSVPLPLLSYVFFNPRAGIHFQASSQWSFYYSLGKTGREPTRNDIFNGYDDLTLDDDGNITNLNLLPESVVNQELGLRWKSEKGHLFANLYHMNFSNEIVLNGELGPNALPLNSSVAQSFRSGLELDFGYNLAGGFRLVNHSAFSHNRINENEISLEPVLTPRVLINQELWYRRKKVGLGFVGRYQSRSFIDYANQVTLPSFLTVDLSASYQLNLIQVVLKVNNLTSQRYYTHGQIGENGDTRYFLQAPIHFFLAARYTFQ
jgi:iron complex outermembrane receptor protein